LVDNRIILDILRTKDEKLAAIRDKINHPKLIEAARERWIPYEPVDKECVTVGIDGSYKKIEYQGLDLYVVDAVAVDSANRRLPVDCSKPSSSILPPLSS
jgi:hypothetical protein